jgi:NRAMP (natural resistance-associated macrophage protein)-like metal ion transporter
MSLPAALPLHRRILRYLRRSWWPYILAIGPGMLAASAGNDAGGIATYASAGAAYGYSLLWVMVIITVAVAIVQEMSARLGAVTGKGFADLVRENFPIRMTAFIMLTLLMANAGIIVSEFVGIAAAAELFGVSRYVAVPLAAFLMWFVITRGSYSRVEQFLLVLSAVFLAYVASAIMVKPDPQDILAGLQPVFHGESAYIKIIVALVGTTISPYMQLYVQSSVVEKGVSIGEFRYTRVDVFVGTLLAGIVATCIIIATAATLHPQGIVIETAADAAMALTPIAGKYATELFGIGLLGASLLAAGILPLSTTYMLSESLGFERGVSRSWQEAPVFMGVFTVLIAFGAVVALIPGLPLISVLVGVYVINGLLLPIELLAIVSLINNKEIMGKYINGRFHNLLVWAIVAAVSLLSLVYIGWQLFEWVIPGM